MLGRQQMQILKRFWCNFYVVLVAKKQDIFEETLGNFRPNQWQKTNSFEETSGYFQVLLKATKPGIFDETFSSHVRCKRGSCKEGSVKFQHRCVLQKRTVPTFLLWCPAVTCNNTDVCYSSAKTKGDDSVSHGYKAQYRYSTIFAQWKIAMSHS